MSEMTPSHIPEPCPRCGAPRRDDDLQGLCARCISDRIFSDADELETGLIRAEPVLRRIGDFELLEELARGGMGIVFRARHVGLDRSVAVKLMRETWLATPRMVERFQAEAAAAASLKHPRIVAIHDIGVENGQHYFAMDLVDGPNLAEVTATGPLSVDRAARLMAAAAEAIQHAHERGVIHRDLKPSNVILDSSGQPNVTDFGLAHPLDDASNLTATGQLLGTPGYMAPEQVDAHAMVGPTTDVYGLGSLFYHLLTGRAPFVGSTLSVVLSQVINSEPASPLLLNPAVPEDLAAVCLKCLRKRPIDRYPSVDKLRQDLERFLRGKPTLVRPTGALEKLVRWCRRQPALATSIAATLLALLLGLAGTTWQWQKAQRALLQTQILAARGRRESGEFGQKRDALKIITSASQTHVSGELRAEAIASLAKLDLAPISGEWFSEPKMESTVVPPTYAVTPDGVWLAHWQETNGDNSIKMETFNGSRDPLPPLNHEGRSGSELVFSNDGTFLAARYYSFSEVGVWDIRRHKLLWHKSVRKDEDFTLEFSPDSLQLAVVSAERKVHLFLVTDGSEVESIQVVGLRDPIRRARFSPDGLRMAIVAGSELIIWDLAQKKVSSREVFSDWPTSAIAWHPDSRRIAVTVWQRQDVFICDANYPPGRRFIDSGGSLIFLLMFSPSGDLLVGRTTDGRTRFWDTATWQSVLSTDAGLASRFLGSGDRLAFDRNNRSVGVWQLERSHILRTFGGSAALRRLSVPAFARDDESLFWCGQQGICSANLTTGRSNDVSSPGVLDLHVDPIDGTLLTAGTSGLQRRTWNGKAATLSAEAMMALGCSTDGRTLVGLASDHLLLIGTTKRSLPLGRLQEPVSLVVDPKARWAFVGTESSGSAVLDLGSGKTLYATEENKCRGAFDPTGTWLAVASARTYGIVRTSNWQRMWNWPRQTSESKSNPGYNPVAISLDGRMLAGALTPLIISLLDPQTGAELARLEAPVPLAIGSLAFSHDSHRLAATSAIGSVQIWEIARLRSELARFGLNWIEPRNSSASH